jgi:hypothetical protein
MVGCRDRDSVDVFVGECFTDVAIQFGPFALGFFDEFRTSLQHFGIDVAESHVFGFILHFEDVFDVTTALPIEADGANSDTAIRVARGGKTGASRGNYGSGASRQKGSSG